MGFIYIIPRKPRDLKKMNKIIIDINLKKDEEGVRIGWVVCFLYWVISDSYCFFVKRIQIHGRVQLRLQPAFPCGLLCYTFCHEWLRWWSRDVFSLMWRFVTGWHAWRFPQGIWSLRRHWGCSGGDTSTPGWDIGWRVWREWEWPIFTRSCAATCRWHVFLVETGHNQPWRLPLVFWNAHSDFNQTKFDLIFFLFSRE